MVVAFPENLFADCAEDLDGFCQVFIKTARREGVVSHERGRQLRQPNRKIRRSGIQYAAQLCRAEVIHRPAQLK